MAEVRWIIPSTLTANYSQTVIARSRSEQGPYTFVHQLATLQGGVPVSSWIDPAANQGSYYIIEYLDPTTQQKFTDYSLGYFPLTPREKRLTTYVAGWIPDILRNDINEAEISMALRLAMNHFNVYPPETTFTMGSFPRNYEQYLIVGAQINLALLKYLKVGIRDFSYSDMGFAITIDRGTKIAKAAEDLNAIYNQTIERAKWNFINQGMGVGSMPLPIGTGGALSRGLMNVLDIFNAVGR